MPPRWRAAPASRPASPASAPPRSARRSMPATRPSTRRVPRQNRCRWRDRPRGPRLLPPGGRAAPRDHQTRCSEGAAPEVSIPSRTPRGAEGAGGVPVEMIRRRRRNPAANGRLFCFREDQFPITIQGPNDSRQVQATILISEGRSSFRTPRSGGSILCSPNNWLLSDLAAAASRSDGGAWSAVCAA